jgi:hypothetical protein
VVRIQEGRHKHRTALLKDLRVAYLEGRLELNAVEKCILDLTNASVRVASKKNDPFFAEKDRILLDNFLLGQDSTLPVTSKYPEVIIQKLADSIKINTNEITANFVQYKNSTSVAKRPVGYSDWQWTALLYNCMSMPSGVFELIADFLPLPRVWQWSLMKLKRRCRLAPSQSLLDLSMLVDEILADANIFAGADQSTMLIKINRNPQIHEFLVEEMNMPQPLLDCLCTWSDVQSLLVRSNEMEVSFKYQMTKQMYSASVALYRFCFVQFLY